MTSSLTDDQLTALRMARGDRMRPSPYLRPQTRRQDQNLLIALMLIERRDGVFQITERGCSYLERIDAETLTEPVDEGNRSMHPAKHSQIVSPRA